MLVKIYEQTKKVIDVLYFELLIMVLFFNTFFYLLIIKK